MNKKTIMLLAGIALAFSTQAQNPITASSIEANGSDLTASITYSPAAVMPSTNQRITLTPCIITAVGDTVAIGESVNIYGRNQYIHLQREGKSLGSNDFRAGNAAESVSNAATLPYTAELNGARLSLRRDIYGCANCLKTSEWFDGAEFTLAPLTVDGSNLTYTLPTAVEAKTTAVEGSAFVEFPVNKTTLLPNFRNNAAELAKIIAVIDSVKADPDVTITAITIKGYASPEGRYDSNARLAEGRTEAMKNYVEKLYHFPKGLITTAYEPEDWAGLRRAVEAMNELPNQQEILAIIDETSLEPDTREWKLKSTYPASYATLLADVYPTLRHSDYRVAYAIADYATPEKVLEVLRVNPSKVSLPEYNLAANSFAAGSAERRALLTQAARQFPSNEGAQLNAATAAFQADDLAAAEAFLRGAGQGADANYLRGLIQVKQGNYAAAAPLLQAAAQAGSNAAAELLPQVLLRK